MSADTLIEPVEKINTNLKEELNRVAAAHGIELSEERLAKLVAFAEYFKEIDDEGEGPVGYRDYDDGFHVNIPGGKLYSMIIHPFVALVVQRCILYRRVPLNIIPPN